MEGQYWFRNNEESKQRDEESKKREKELNNWKKSMPIIKMSVIYILCIHKD